MAKELTQEEIDRLLSGGGMPAPEKSVLTAEEIDLIGEIGNISMGSSATAISKILNKKVSITTPRVSVMKTSELAEKFPMPFVAIEIQYTEGLTGKNVLNLKNRDVKIITDLMMGGKGVADEGPLSEMNLSAAGELMNQMMGSSSTSLSEMLNIRIDISPPEPRVINYAEDKPKGMSVDEELVIVNFDFEVENTLQSELILIMPIEFAKGISSMVRDMYLKKSSQDKKEPKAEPAAAKKQPEPQERKPAEPKPEKKHEEAPAPKVNVQEMHLKAFGEDRHTGQTADQPNKYDIILDVPLEVTVEIGRVSKQISEILQFTNGTILELEKLAGEAVDIVINNKVIGRGDVVVVDECYGVRITEIK